MSSKKIYLPVNGAFKKKKKKKSSQMKQVKDLKMRVGSMSNDGYPYKRKERGF